MQYSEFVDSKEVTEAARWISKGKSVGLTADAQAPYILNLD